jgi:hypothetical protein
MNRICTREGNNTTTSSGATGSSSTATSTTMTMTKTVLSTDSSNTIDDVNYVVVTSINPNQSCTVPNRKNYGNPYKPIISTTADNMDVIERTVNTTTTDDNEEEYNFCHYSSSTTDINSSASLSVLSFTEILVYDYYIDTTYNVTTSNVNDLVCVNIHDSIIERVNMNSSNNTNSTLESQLQPPPPPPISPFVMNHQMHGSNNTNSMMMNDDGPPMLHLNHYRTVNNDFIWEQIKTLFQLSLNHP